MVQSSAQKNLLGSVTYSIQFDLLQALTELEDIYVRMSFFEHKHKLYEHIVDDFKGLITELGSFWLDEAHMQIFPQRMAAWLAEFLGEIGITRYPYEVILAMIRRLNDERNLLAMLRNMLGDIDPDVKPSLRPLNLDFRGKNPAEVVRLEVDNQIIAAPKTIDSSIIYIDNTGKVQAIKAKQEIEKEEGSMSMAASTTFENPLDVSLTNVQINNVVPYHYKVMGTTIEGFEDIQPKKKLLDEGLQLTWTLPEVKPKQKVQAELDLERRISRTIIANISEKVDLIQTWFNIVPAGERYAANGQFTNVYSAGVNNLVIEDEIPLTFHLVDVVPTKDVQSFNPDRQHFENLVKWQYAPVEIARRLDHGYTLADRRLLVISTYDFSSIKGCPVRSVLKIAEPNLIFNEMSVSIYIELAEHVPELDIREISPEQASIAFQSPSYTARGVEILEGSSIQNWKLLPSRGSNRVTFGYVCSGIKSTAEVPLEITIPGGGTYRMQAKPVVTRKEAVLLPEFHEYISQHKRQRSTTA
nr:hypothetical protein [Candidatus Sigynarchaeum springense]